MAKLPSLKAGAMRAGWSAMRGAANVGRRVSSAVSRARTRVKALTGKNSRKFTDLSKLPSMKGMDVGERTQKAAGAARTIQKFVRNTRAKSKPAVKPNLEQQAYANVAQGLKNATAGRQTTRKQAMEEQAFANVAQGLKKQTAGRQTSRKQAMSEAKTTQNRKNVIGELKMVQDMRREENAAATIGRLGRRVVNRKAGKRTISEMKAATSSSNLPEIPDGSNKKQRTGVRSALRSAASKVASAGRSAANKWANTDNYTKLVLGTTAASAISKIAKDEEDSKRRKAEDDARKRAASYV